MLEALQELERVVAYRHRYWPEKTSDHRGPVGMSLRIGWLRRRDNFLDIVHQDLMRDLSSRSNALKNATEEWRVLNRDGRGYECGI